MKDDEKPKNCLFSASYDIINFVPLLTSFDVILITLFRDFICHLLVNVNIYYEVSDLMVQLLLFV